jgi:Cdc6-like AAA superfamily ATPase
MNIESRLHYLLTRTEPFILLLKGEWGVGKTYFIKEFIKRHHHTFAKTTYSYVSLFGIPTTDEFMQTIFLNSMSMDMLEAGNLGASSTDEISKRVKFLFDRAKPILSSVTRTPILGVNNIRSFVVSNAAAFFNRNSLIVIDDLERHSPTLSVSDIMGILTQLKEERNCQIIIVMNEDALRTAQGAEPVRPIFGQRKKSSIES